MDMFFNPFYTRIKKYRWLVAVCSCLSFYSPFASADTIEAKLPSGVTAYADFRAGSSAQSAVLILHGFLQTHHSQPMNSLASNLAAAGHTVLSPTMSLGINRRSQSMACEAAHTHTMDDEVAEITYWVNWLSNKGFKHVIPVGFSSSGGIALLQYNAQGAHPSIKKIILVGLNPIAINHAEAQKFHAAHDAKQKPYTTKLNRFSLGYCKNNFSATANTYLSYSGYIEKKLLDLIRQSTLPVEIILGTDDHVLPANWSSKISALESKSHVHLIDKANHFFDGTTELDLAEKIESILKTLIAK